MDGIESLYAGRVVNDGHQRASAIFFKAMFYNVD